MKPLLKELRKSRGLTQEQLSERLGVKLATYRTWERGSTNMSFPQAVACAEILGCSLDELAGREAIVIEPDPNKAALDYYYGAMGDAGRSVLVESARLMSGKEE